MSPLAKLAMALTLVAATAGAAGDALADPSGGARTDSVTLGSAGQPAASGVVNLEGFAKPIAPGALGPTAVQTTVVSVGGVNVGALSEFGVPAGRAGEPVGGGRGDAAVIGGYAGYRFASENDPRGGYGVNLRFGADPLSSTDTWRVQPGFDYTTSLGASWQLNSRLFSTYNLEGTSASSRAGVASGEDRGFRDVGLSLGLGYAPSDRWTVQTQATYAVPLRSQDKSRSSEEGESTNEFFGGVILNYRF